MNSYESANWFGLNTFEKIVEGLLIFRVIKHMDQLIIIDRIIIEPIDKLMYSNNIVFYLLPAIWNEPESGVLIISD